MLNKIGQWVFDLPGCPKNATCAAVDKTGEGFWFTCDPDNVKVLGPFWCRFITYDSSKLYEIVGYKFDTTGWENSKIIREKKMENKMPEFETGDIALTDSGRYWLKCGAVWYELGSYSSGDTEIVSSTNWPPSCDGSEFVALYRDDCFAYDEIGDVMYGKVKPIWKCESVKEMTVDEISAALGYKVKVVGDGLQ